MKCKFRWLRGCCTSDERDEIHVYPTVPNVQPIHDVVVAEDMEEELILPDEKYIRILIAEDNKITLDIMKRMLRIRSNIVVETVSDGARALELVTNAGSKNRYSLVVLDVHLISMDGDRVVRGIRQRNIDVPIFVVTADEKKGEKCKKIGADAVLLKPLKKSQFLNIIDELVCPPTTLEVIK